MTERNTERLFLSLLALAALAMVTCGLLVGLWLGAVLGVGK